MNNQVKKSLISKPIQYDDALIISLIRYGESDCVVKMFTKECGRVSAFFKRGLANKKGGGIQAPSLAKVGLITSSQKLLRLCSSDCDPRFFFPLSLKNFAYGSYIAEIIDKFLPEEDPAPEIFSLAEEAFLMLTQKEADAAFLRAFELKFLDYTGFLPEFPEDLTASKIIAFDPQGSRFLTTLEESSVEFSIDALLLAKSMLIAKIGTVNYEGPELTMIGRIFLSRLKMMGLFPLKSTGFLKQLSKRPF